jgi:hypothetical protein
VNNSGQVYIELPANSYSVWVQGTATVLPLQLLRFNAQAVDKVVQLKWAVEQNEDIKSFDVERSDDGVAFIKVGSRLALNRTGGGSYDFVDATPKKNTGLLYRLKLIGRDGTVLYSELKMVRVDEGEVAVKMKQNPVRNQLDFDITATENSKATVSIISSGGQRVLLQNIRLATGLNPVSLPVTSLATGIYQLVVEAGNRSKIISFVKE